MAQTYYVDHFNPHNDRHSIGDIIPHPGNVFRYVKINSYENTHVDGFMPNDPSFLNTYKVGYGIGLRTIFIRSMSWTPNPLYAPNTGIIIAVKSHENHKEEGVNLNFTILTRGKVWVRNDEVRNNEVRNNNIVTFNAYVRFNIDHFEYSTTPFIEVGTPEWRVEEFHDSDGLVLIELK